MSNDPRVLVLEEMRKQTALLERIAAALTNGASSNAAQTPAVDLDSQHGDPVVKAKSPKDWTGDNMTGRKFSECPPSYLDMVADRLDYFAGKEEDAKKAKYNRLDAARARGWAARLRAGWKPATAPVLVNEADSEPQWDSPEAPGW